MLDPQSLARGENRLMLCKADVDQVPPVCYRLIGKTLCNIAELVKRRYLPDDIVAETDVL